LAVGFQSFPVLFTFTDTFCADQRSAELSFDQHKIA